MDFYVGGAIAMVALGVLVVDIFFGMLEDTIVHAIKRAR